MSRQSFYDVLTSEVAAIDDLGTSKRHEVVIESFTKDPEPLALINGKKVHIFNSNDYLGLRHHAAVKKGEKDASEQYGAGPGAVRFISGSLAVHRDLEQKLAQFHGRDDAMIFSSAFATNLAVLFCLIKGQRKDTLVASNVLVVSDALNHRSIIDGIRLANLGKEEKTIFKHMDPSDLERVLQEHVGKFARALIVTDGVFSMLGEIQRLKEIRAIIDSYDSKYPEGVLLVVDDAHGIGACGKTGRGTEEVTGAKADVLVGTMGKAFGADGGYVVANQKVIDYLREASATYIYSNSISPGTAGAALASLNIVEGTEGQALLTNLEKNKTLFKTAMTAAGFTFAADSNHPIQPILIGDAKKAGALTKGLLQEGYLVTNLSYPVVTAGRDEIRVQISATHTEESIRSFVTAAKKVATSVGIL